MKNRGNCDGYWEMLNDYADGRLHGHASEKAESHLAECKQCREALADIRSIRQGLVCEPVEKPSLDLWEECYQRIGEDGTPRRVSKVAQVWKPAFGVAVASIVAGLALLLAPCGHPQATEIPMCDLVMQHAGFAASQPLSISSHHVLLTARCMEEKVRTDDDSE